MRESEKNIKRESEKVREKVKEIEEREGERRKR